MSFHSPRTRRVEDVLVVDAELRSFVEDLVHRSGLTSKIMQCPH